MGASLAPYWPTFLALALLIVASAFFSGSEAALISLSRLHARAMVDRGVKGSQAVVRLLEDRNRLLTSILIGNTIVLHGRKLGTHLGVNLKTEEDRRMHDLLQDDGAMLDWIAVPNFLDAYK